ncbi:MAG: hypothetical protein RLZZ126_1183 [Pseudomonadota bacterium]|jgi:hypothetical protein
MSLWINTMNRFSPAGLRRYGPAVWACCAVLATGPMAAHAQSTRDSSRDAAAQLSDPLPVQEALPRPGLRQFPRHAQRGVMLMLQPPELTMNGLPDRLSPGSRIRGPNNQLVMSGQLVGRKLTVNFTRNPQGQIHDVWIITALEAEQELPGSGPQRNFRFGSDAQAGPRDDGKTPFDQLPKYKY